MCIYFVNHYHCGHYADLLTPTVLSHCRTYDTCLRYWHDQIYYQPLEATYAEYGTVVMPQPCRPIWPIPFPSKTYLPIPKVRNHPRGLARPRPNDIPIPEAGPQELETPTERFNRENQLLQSMGRFRDVVAHQEYQTRLSIAEETRAYEAKYPNSGAQSIRVAGVTPGVYEPQYPLAFIAAILTFSHARGQPNQPPNVIITQQPNSGCQRTISNACRYKASSSSSLLNRTRPSSPQCPFLLATRTPWLYPRDARGNLTKNNLPMPRGPASFLADFRTRGGAITKHMEKDPSGSELTRVAMHSDGSVGFIEPSVYLRLQNPVPDGPWARMRPGQNVFAEPFLPEVAPEVRRFLAPSLLPREQRRVEEASGEEISVASLAGRATARWAERRRREIEAEAQAAEADAAGAENEAVEEEVAPEEPSGYRHRAGGGAVDWVSEGGREGNEEDDGEERGGREWRSDVG